MSIFDPLEKEQRAHTYRMFAYLFTDVPDEDLIEEFEDFAGITVADTYEEICDDFINLFSEASLPNYEGYYREQIYRDIPIDLSLNDVQHFYWSAGITLEEEFDLPPDHISIELLFMSYLIEENLIDLQIDFLRRLSEWIPLFCDYLYEKANTDFYKEVATALKEFVLSECGGYS